MLQSTHQSTHTHMAPVNGQRKENRECLCPRTLERHGVSAFSMPKARGLDWETDFCWVSEKWARNPQRIEVWTRGSARCKCRLPIRSSCSRVWPGTWEGRDAKDAKTCMQWNLQRGPSSTEYLDIYIYIYIEFSSPLLVRCPDRDACLKEAKPPNK